MSFKTGIKISNRELTALTILSLLFLLIHQLTVHRQLLPEHDIMRKAAQGMTRAEAVLRTYCQTKGLPINRRIDPLESGFIGVEFSPITTTLGNLQAKQLSTNPDFAALFSRWFFRLGLHKGDIIVIHSSGSFPALCSAAIIAAEVNGLNPKIFSSLGASSFGANRPELTYWDMERILFEQGVIRHRTIFATPGGQNDNGSSFWPGGMAIARQAAMRNGLMLHIPNNLSQAIKQKLAAIQSYPRIRLFINIGGNQAAVGTFPCSMRIPVGLIRHRLRCVSQPTGLIHILNRQGLPIIHILHIKEIALNNGLSISPDKAQSKELSGVYFKKESPLALNVLLIVILIGLWVAVFLRRRG